MNELLETDDWRDNRMDWEADNLRRQLDRVESELAAARKRIAELENKVNWLKECRKTNREHIAELRKRLETDANTSS
ncbi:MAG: hypothetical protein ACYTFW_26145 [Planctomycetota bacterium]|jgi:predicted  nucleic acid-binding Zn-ribbon protein